MKRIVVNVFGRVQGVGYRYYVVGGAETGNVTGYVRNMPGGSVQVIAEGAGESLLKFIRYLHAADDPVICVDHLEVEWGTSTGEFSGFRVRY